MAEAAPGSTARGGERWLTRGVGALGGASLLADLGHEVPTALLPSLLTSTLGAPAAALGAIEGLADGVAGAARLAGGPLADDPVRRRRLAVGGYAATAVLTAGIGAATAVWQVACLRVAGWAARGLRVPARNALLADLVPPSAYGRAYGLERALDNLGAIGGPLLALALVALVGVRGAILLSVVPGLLAAAAILVAAREAPRAAPRARRPLRARARHALRGGLARLFLGVGAVELGNVSATLLVLRATDVLEPERGHGGAVAASLALYAGHNLAAALASLGGGRLADRVGGPRVLSGGAAALLAAYAGFAVAGPSLPALALLFATAGAGIGLVETAEHTAVASRAPVPVRGTAFGLLAAVQALGNLVASAGAGALWTLVSPRAAFLALGVPLLAGALALARLPGRPQPGEPSSQAERRESR